MSTGATRCWSVLTDPVPIRTTCSPSSPSNRKWGGKTPQKKMKLPFFIFKPESNNELITTSGLGTLDTNRAAQLTPVSRPLTPLLARPGSARLGSASFPGKRAHIPACLTADAPSSTDWVRAELHSDPALTNRTDVGPHLKPGLVPQLERPVGSNRHQPRRGSQPISSASARIIQKLGEPSRTEPKYRY